MHRAESRARLASLVTPSLSLPLVVSGTRKEFHLNLVLHVIYLVAVIYSWLIVGRAVLSWFRFPPGSPVFFYLPGANLLYGTLFCGSSAGFCRWGAPALLGSI